MKTKNFLLIVFGLVCMFSIGQNKFAYYQDNQLYIASLDGSVSLLGSDIKIKEEKRIITSREYSYSFMSKDVLTGMELSDGFEFYSAVQSMDNENHWLFTERNMQNIEYNVWSYNHETKAKNLLFSQDNSPVLIYAFIPFAWIENTVYLEARDFNNLTENEGIWSYNMETKQFSKLPISISYLTTPVVSPTGKSFVYAGTMDSIKTNDSRNNAIFIYDIATNKETLIKKEINSRFSIFGWIDDDIEKTDLINIIEDEFDEKQSIKSQSLQPAFKLPWPKNVTHCVSGGSYWTPPGNIGSSITCGPQFTTNHKNISFDFTGSSITPCPILAVADGTVIWAGNNNNDSGIYVKVRHTDGTYTFYIHLSSVTVSKGQSVKQGQRVGIEGNTGCGTCGVHLHFEWVDVGEKKFNDIYGLKFPVFDECNCTPRRNYQYKSNNLEVSATPSPTNDNCPGTSITSNGDCLSGTVAGATTSYGPNQCSGSSTTSSDDNDVYYQFTAMATSHTVTVSNYSSDFDAVIELRSACSTGTSLGCYDPTSKPSTVSYTWNNLTIGNKYFVRVFEFNNSGTPPTTPTFTICVTHTVNTQPDLIVQSPQVTPSSLQMGQTVTASCYVKNQGTGNASASVTAVWISSDQSFGGDTNLGDISVPALNSNTKSNLLSKQIKIPLGPYAGTWYIMFGCNAMDDINESNKNNNQVFVPITFTTINYPENDEPCNATILNVSSNNTFTEGTNVNATNSTVPNITCDGTTCNGDVWYKFTVPSSGRVVINSKAGIIDDMGMSLYTGSSCNSLTYFGCYPNGSTYSPFMPYASLTGLTPNTTMWIRLWEYNNNSFGTFSIALLPITTGINDVISNNIWIYPNPTSGKLVISEIETLGNKFKVDVVDFQGKIIYSSVYSDFGNKISLDLSTFPKGLYLIRLSNNEATYQKKVIKN